MFSEKERILANEASLASSLLGHGLNALRRADEYHYNKGLYYQAFFSLSIGIERLLKIIIISQHRYKSEGIFPEDIKLKKMGHDLSKLCKSANIEFENIMHGKLIEFLNGFSKIARYYNIDFVVGESSNNTDPLREWALIEHEIYKAIPKKKKIQDKEVLAPLINQVSLVIQYDLQGNLVTSASDLLTASEVRETIKGYPTQFMFEMVKVLAGELRRLELENEKYLMPVLSEFFDVYTYDWRPFEIRRKKNWLNI